VRKFGIPTGAPAFYQFAAISPQLGLFYPTPIETVDKKILL